MIEQRRFHNQRKYWSTTSSGALIKLCQSLVLALGAIVVGVGPVVRAVVAGSVVGYEAGVH
jgi:hypothetical protein